MTRRYPPQAVLVYVALGIALGLVGWALWIYDGSGGNGSAPTQPQDTGGERP